MHTDNIASPLAACLGDFLTLFILALVGSALVYGLSTPIPFVATLVMVVTTLAVRWYCRLPKHSHGSKRVKETEEEEEGAWWPLVSLPLVALIIVSPTERRAIRRLLPC
jgi:solute carrier family 41